MKADVSGGPGVAAAGVLECVANVSEGRDAEVVRSLAKASGPWLLDVHSDANHNRSVFTIAGPPAEVESGVRELARWSVGGLDLARHAGEHPRFGVLDVVPWVALEGWPLRDARAGSPAASAAQTARDGFAVWVSSELAVPVFLYGPGRSLPTLPTLPTLLSLPEVRRRAWKDLLPDYGPSVPHRTAGSVAVGWRPLLVAYNLWMSASVRLEQARAIATGLRSAEVRALAFKVENCFQVSCNLLRPLSTGPAHVFDQVAQSAPVQRAEVVGLVPRLVLDATPEARWPELGLTPERTIEARLEEAALRAASRS